MKTMFSALRSILGSRQTEPSVPPEEYPGQLINAYATRTTVPAFAFPHKLHARRDSSDPALAEHLRGFTSYVQAQADGTLTQHRYHVLRHIQRVQQHLSVSVPDDRMDDFAEWAKQANAIAFLRDGTLRDPQGRILVAPGGKFGDSDGVVPFPIEAEQRKARTTGALEGLGFVVAPHLPPREGESEVRLRTAAEVLGRACALLVVAVRAESVNSGDPIPLPMLQRLVPAAFQHLTPDEAAFVGMESPDHAVVARFAWCYECLFVLEWVLGLIPELSFPSSICNAGTVAEAMRQASGMKPGRIQLVDATH